MTREDFQLAREVFADICDIPVDQQREAVKRRCTGRPGVKRLVEAMLREDAADDFALVPPTPPIDIDAVATAVNQAEVPAQIGHYRVIRVCGYGGMGAVYEAEQDSPRRRVALKMIRSLSASREVLQRFRREAEMLGRLQHPGIGQIFEAGSTDIGDGRRPYFAMEFVEGQPLTTYANERGLPLRDRLELMARVCDAVHYAHQRGIIHRDLKPDNILVSSEATADGSGTAIGQPKVLDFGIARVTDADVQNTMQTHVGQLIGTLQYMSPEQAAGDPAALDTRSDIYALGVVLYELLTGKLPYELHEQSVPQSLRTIQEETPSRLSSYDGAFRGDIETIVGKCLEKEPDRRYQSASELSEDIRRYLRDEPIAARPPSTFYQLRKFARRNRALVIGTFATILALLLGLIGTARFAWQAWESQLILARQAYQAKIAAASGLVMTDPITARRYLEQTEEAQRGWEWRHLYSQLDRHVMAYEAPVPSVGPIVVTPDGRKVVSALTDHRIAVWDEASGALIRMQPIEHAVSQIAGPEQGAEKVAIGSRDGRVLIWDLSDDAPREVLKAPDGLVVHHLAWGRAGRWLAVHVGSDDERAQFVQDSRIVILRNEAVHGQIMFAGTAQITGMAFSADSARLVLARYGVTVIDVDTASVAWTEDVARAQSLAVSWPANANRIYLGTEQRSVVPVDLTSRKALGRWTGHQQPVSQLASSADGALLASCGGDGTIRLWNTTIGAAVAVVDIGSASPLAFGAGETHLLYRRDGRVEAWDLSVGPALVLLGHDSFVYFTNWSRDGALLVSGERFANNAIVWDPIAGHAIRRLAMQHPTNFVCFDETGRYVFTGLSRVDISTGREVASAFAPRVRRLGQQQCADAAGSREATGWHTGAILAPAVVYQHRPPYGDSVPGSLGPREEIARFEGEYYGVALSPDGRLLAAGTQAGIDIWDVDSRDLVARLTGHTSSVYTVDFSPDGARLASGSNDNTVRIWDTQSWEQVAELRGHEQYVMSVQFSPDGTQLATASGDYTVRIWDTVPRAERARQAREFAALVDETRPRVAQLLNERGDAGLVAERLADQFSSPPAYRAALRALIELTPDPPE